LVTTLEQVVREQWGRVLAALMGFLAGQADRLLRTTATTSPAYATIPPTQVAQPFGQVPQHLQVCSPVNGSQDSITLAGIVSLGRVAPARSAATAGRPSALPHVPDPRPPAGRVVSPRTHDQQRSWNRQLGLCSTGRRGGGAASGVFIVRFAARSLERHTLRTTCQPSACPVRRVRPGRSRLVARRAGDPVGPTEPAGEVALVGEPGREGDLGDRRPRRQPPPGLSQPELAQVGAGRNPVPVPELAPGRRTTRPSAPPKEDSTRRRTIALLITRPLTCGTDFWHSTGRNAMESDARRAACSRSTTAARSSASTRQHRRGGEARSAAMGRRRAACPDRSGGPLTEHGGLGGDAGLLPRTPSLSPCGTHPTCATCGSHSTEARIVSALRQLDRERLAVGAGLVLPEHHDLHTLGRLGQRQHWEREPIAWPQHGWRLL
jgi:hypothetical protein